MYKIDMELPEGYSARWMWDADPDVSYLEQEEFAEHRAAYYRDEWTHVVVLLEKVCDCCGRPGVVGSVGSVEYDYSPDNEAYLRQIALELMEEDA